MSACQPPDQPVAPTATPARTPSVFFDNSIDTQQQSLIDNGWIITTAPDWPGVPKAVEKPGFYVEAYENSRH
jgi:hypothetical protein